MPLDLGPIMVRLAAASQGPWQAEQEQLGARSKPVYIVWSKAHVVARCGSVGMPKAQEDTDLIAHAPTDLAALIQEVERLRAIETAARALLGPAESGRETVARWEVLRTALEAETGRLRGLTDLIRQVEARGWLWEGGHYQAARGLFFARVWAPGTPADERWGYGATIEEATQQAISLLPAKVGA